jgi:hypothetical protein
MNTTGNTDASNTIRWAGCRYRPLTAHRSLPSVQEVPPDRDEGCVP